MDRELVWFVVGLVLGGIVIVGFILQDIYLAHKIRRIEKQNVKLRNENIGLMRHNGKLYDENQELKHSTDKDNTPSFDPW